MTEPRPFFPNFLDQAPQPICWVLLEAAHEAAALHELDTWVTWLAERYRLDHRTLPGCWPKHGDLVEELSALYTAWQNAFTIGARPEAPLDWHASFAEARVRLVNAVARSGCRRDEHHST